MHLGPPVAYAVLLIYCFTYLPLFVGSALLGVFGNHNLVSFLVLQSSELVALL